MLLDRFYGFIIRYIMILILILNSVKCFIKKSASIYCERRYLENFCITSSISGF